jgi:hypothetical protein
MQSGNCQSEISVLKMLSLHFYKIYSFKSLKHKVVLSCVKSLVHIISKVSDEVWSVFGVI